MAIKVTRDVLKTVAMVGGFPASDARLDELREDVEWMLASIRSLDEVDVEGLEPAPIAVVPIDVIAGE